MNVILFSDHVIISNKYILLGINLFCNSDHMTNTISSKTVNEELFLITWSYSTTYSGDFCKQSCHFNDKPERVL